MISISNADGAAGRAPRYLHAWLGWEPRTPEIKTLPDG